MRQNFVGALYLESLAAKMSAVSRPKASSQRSRAASSGPSGVGQGSRSSRPPSKGSGVTKRQNQSKSSGDILRAKEEEYRWVGAVPCTSSRFLFICSAALEISVVYMYHICNWYLHHVTHAPCHTCTTSHMHHVTRAPCHTCTTCPPFIS